MHNVRKSARNSNQRAFPLAVALNSFWAKPEVNS